MHSLTLVKSPCPILIILVNTIVFRFFYYFFSTRRLKKALGEGLLKAAKTTGAWILTGIHFTH